MDKSKVLIVGGTGYLGRRMVKASLDQGHITYILHRREIGLDIDKVQMLLSFKQQGARLVEGSFSDHQSLVDAVKLVDVVICTISGVHIRSHMILLQLKLVEAIKEAGNVQEPAAVHYRPTYAITLHTDTFIRFICRTGAQTQLSNKIHIMRRLVELMDGPCTLLENLEAHQQVGLLLRFLPSEFGMDPSRMEHAMEPGNATFKEKMVVRKAIEEAKIPFTYVSANCFAGYFVGGLCQFGKITPSKENVVLFGDANVKGIFVDEYDIATYAIKAIDDPRTQNKTIYLRPPENILTQREIVEIWEKLIGKQVEKSSMSAKDFLGLMKALDHAQQAGLTHYYHVCYEGCLTNFEIENDQEASKLYPEVNYTRVVDYLKRYL